MNNNYSLNKYKQPSPIAYRRQESGIALVIGLLLLLVITILSVVAMRGTTMQERMSANNQQQATTFQGSEAAIRAVMNEIRAITPQPAGVTQSVLITALQNGTSPSSSQLTLTQRTAVTNNGTTNTATMTFTGVGATGSVPGFGSKYAPYNFTITANSTQANTNSSSTNQQGIYRPAPALE
jgi:type IV pilus assembly protein PilX